MSAEVIGKVKSGVSHKLHDVKWDTGSKEVYVANQKVGKANSAAEAMRKAEAFLYNK